MVEIPRTNRSFRLGGLLVTTCVALAVAACGSSSSSTPAAPAKPTGTASVAAAASLSYLSEKVIGPAFTKAEGYKYSGTYNASGELSSDIASGEITPNVFESVGGDNIAPLEPKFTKWYAQYAGTSMVVAYNPNSKYASQFKAYADGSKPLSGLFKLLETPGLKLGRTDPNIDPQGRDFIYMLELAQAYYHLPSNTVAKILGTSDFGSSTSPQIYAESALDATLQSGQLDASSAFITQADRAAPGLHQAAARRSTSVMWRSPTSTLRRWSRSPLPAPRWSSPGRRSGSTSRSSASRPRPGSRSSSTPFRLPVWLVQDGRFHAGHAGRDR